jgi:hypothetical protein
VGAERGGDPLKFLTSSGLIRKLKSRFGPKSICANLLGLIFGWRFVGRLVLYYTILYYTIIIEFVFSAPLPTVT